MQFTTGDWIQMVMIALMWFQTQISTRNKHEENIKEIATIRTKVSIIMKHLGFGDD